MKFTHKDAPPHELLIKEYAKLDEEAFAAQVRRDQAELVAAFGDAAPDRVHMCQVKHWAVIEHLQGTDEPEPA